MDAPTSPSQPPQPPKEASYNQSTNPVTQSQKEQRTGTDSTTSQSQSQSQSQSTIHRTPGDSIPTTSHHTHHKHHDYNDNSAQADPEYGVEQQPAEGDIAAAVESKGRQGRRQQAGAHAGPVGSAAGPGDSGSGEQPDLMSDLDRKSKEHQQRLDDKGWKGEGVGREEGSEEGVLAERERLRKQKMQEEEELDVKGAVGKGTGDVVVS